MATREDIMKRIICCGGEAHGRMVLDTGATKLRLAADPPQYLNVPKNGVDDLVKIVDGYTRHTWEQLGWTHEVMLCDTERPEDRNLWSAGLKIEPTADNEE